MADSKYPRLQYALDMGLVWIDGEEYRMIEEDGSEVTIGWIEEPSSAEDYLCYYLMGDDKE